MISSGKQALVGRRVKTRLKVPVGEAITDSSDKSISLCMQKVLLYKMESVLKLQKIPKRKCL